MSAFRRVDDLYSRSWGPGMNKWARDKHNNMFMTKIKKGGGGQRGVGVPGYVTEDSAFYYVTEDTSAIYTPEPA